MALNFLLQTQLVKESDLNDRCAASSSHQLRWRTVLRGLSAE
jgi:hypothetical protein